MSLRKIIRESLEKELNEEILEEGLRDWALAGLMTLSSIAGLAQTKTEFNPDQIKGAKEIQDRISNNDPELNKMFNEKEIAFINKNADKLTAIDEKDFQDYSMVTMNTNNLKTAIANARVYGYAISDIQVNSDTIIPKGAIFITKDTIVIQYNSDALFKTAEFNLTQESISNIENTIQAISSQYRITKVTIISSTDKEPIKMGNEQLAQLRAESVQSVLNGMVDSILIVPETLPEQGPDVYKPGMTSQEREIARASTAEFRFVKIVIEAEKEIDVTVTTTIPEIIKTYKFELVKIISHGDGKKIHGKNLKRKVYVKSGSKKVKYDGHILGCTL